MTDPRRPGGGTVGVIGFYHPGKDEPWDTRCGSGFMGNFWELGTDNLKVTAKAPGCAPAERSFRNAEAAFQALKWWDKAEQFRHCSGKEAFDLKRKLESTGTDTTYGDFGGNWSGMKAVLRAKFRQGTPCATALLQTADTFLLEHNSTPKRDFVWSDNCIGDGKNWLGLQLMLVRDELGGDGAWTRFIKDKIDLNTGMPAGDGAAQVWQQAVANATTVLCGRLGLMPSASQDGGGPSEVVPTCKRPGCNRPTYNGQPNEYCGRTCQRGG